MACYADATVFMSLRDELQALVRALQQIIVSASLHHDLRSVFFTGCFKLMLYFDCNN
jgi:hypothetical protein